MLEYSQIQDLFVDQIKKAEVDPFDYNGLTYSALEIVGVPFSRINPNFPYPGYNPLQNELIVAPSPQVAEAIQDLIDTMPGTNILSVAKLVSFGMPGFIIPFFDPDADLRAWSIHEKQIDDIGDEMVEVEALRSCYVAAYERIKPRLDPDCPDFKVTGIDLIYRNLTAQGVRPATPELVAAWMSRPYRSRLEERIDLSKVIFGQSEDQDFPKTA